MAEKCRHRKGLILASACDIKFVPDQEPFEDGIIEPSGYEHIHVGVIDIIYCPKCNEIIEKETSFDELSAESL